jgi:di/tricarboxylate transporter
VKSEILDTSADALPVPRPNGVPTLRRWTLPGIALGVFAVAVIFCGQSIFPPPWLDDLRRLAAILIFSATYLFMAVGRLPGYHLDRAGAALLGASLMAGLGVLSLQDAYRAIDFDTITVLLGMMIVVANLRLSGFFGLVSAWVVTRARHPLVLLAAVVLVAGSFSAFLVNDRRGRTRRRWFGQRAIR